MSTTTNGSESQRRDGDRSEWQGYEWQVHLDEIVDCDKCSPGCRTCYYKCRGLPVACKAGMIIAFLTTTILITALIVRFGSFGPGVYLVGNGDQIQFSDGSSQNEDNSFSRLFCSDLTLTSTSTPPREFNSFAVMAKPTRSPDRWKYNLNETILVSYGSYVYIIHTFHPSDSVIIKGCVPTYEMDATLYVFRGEENYKAWTSCSSCYTTTVFRPCSYQEHNELHLTFTSTDIVYFAYTLEYGYPPRADLALQFSFDRTRYEKTRIVDVCVSTSSCKLSIPLHTVDVLIDGEFRLSENTNKIRTECGARLSIYFAFFVAVPAGLVLVIACLALLLKRCQDDLIRDMERADRLREYNTFGARRPTSTPTRRGNRTAASSRRPTFSSSSLSANRALSVSATVPLVENEQRVGSLPDYSSLVINEPSPPTYHEVTCETVTNDQSDNGPPPPAYDDVSNVS